MCLSSPGPPRNPCALRLTFIPSLPVLADLKKEKHRATEKSFHFNPRNVRGEMCLWVCFKILQFGERGEMRRREINEKGSKIWMILEAG